MKKLLTAVLAGALWASGAAAAMAHVTLNPREAIKGRYAKFDVRVPTERDNAGTTKVDLQLPEDQAFASVSVQPVPGWTYAVVKRHLATPLVDDDGNKTEDVVTQITWTAEPDVSITPGEFQEFPISLGPLPENADSLAFKAIQTYDSGEVVRWIETAAEGQPEPEHPAPRVALVEAPASGGAVSAPAASTSDAKESASNGRATAALVMSIVAAALAIGALMAARKSSPAGSK